MMNVEDDRNCWVLANKLKFLLKAENTDAKIYMIQQIPYCLRVKTGYYSIVNRVKFKYFYGILLLNYTCAFCIIALRRGKEAPETTLHAVVYFPNARSSQICMVVPKTKAQLKTEVLEP